KWLAPAALGILALGLLTWLLWPKAPVAAPEVKGPPVASRTVGAPQVDVPQVAVPDVARVTSDLSGDLSSLTSAISDIKDPAGAEVALPKLTELATKLDSLKAMADKLPDAARSKITDMAKASLGKVEGQFAKLMWVPGVGDKVKPAMDEVLGKLASLGGVPVP